jgi:peptidoglycan hydrolase-like protein with peptidoglycan-binding domain
MSFQRVHQSRSQTPQTSWSTSQFAPRPLAVQEPKCPPTQEDIKNEAFQQNKFEAFGLQLKEKHSTITPVEQERLGLLQAKMDSFWAQRMERAKAQPNLLEILIRNAQSTQVTEPATEPATPVQPKLTIGQPNDQYEQEADRVAEQVMSMALPATPNLQRQSEEEQEELQTKPLVETITPIVQRQDALKDQAIQAKCESCEEEEQVQRSLDGVPQVQADLENRLNASKGEGSPLPDEVRSFMEPRFRTNFSQVRAHTDSEAVQMNRELNAQAFTHKQNIYFSSGKNPGNDVLTAHELTHVVQQTGAIRLKPSQDTINIQQKYLACAEKRAVETLSRSYRDSGIIQRTIGDGHDLTSSRFAGDSELEACFDDEARLTQGSKGASVIKVQQALIDLAYDLGTSGADGIYGTRTWKAVKQFKADQHLGFEHMGDVGPGTMSRLNELFSSQSREAPPPAFADENDSQACPTDEDIVLAVERQPDLASEFVGEQTSITSAAFASPTVSSGGHVSIPEAIRRFKQKANATNVTAGGSNGMNVSDRGQFFWGGQMWSSVTSELDRMKSEPTAQDFVNKAREARDQIWDRQDANLILAELLKIASKSNSPQKPAMFAMLQGHQISGGALEDLLWSAFNKRTDDTTPAPELQSFRSLLTLRKLVNFDKQGCGFHAVKVAQRLKKKGGITASNPQVAPFPGVTLANGGGIQDRRPIGRPVSAFEPAATSAVDPSSHFQLGDHIFQSGVLSAVAKMQQALDAGQLIHARVLSGDGQGGSFGSPQLKTRPHRIAVSTGGEHSLLIIGYEGSSFVFHDPDASVSHNPESGFGMLFYDFTDDRLSTAEKPADMPVKDGEHRNRNHRYQILTLSAV